MKKFDIIKWAKEELVKYDKSAKWDDQSYVIATWIDCTLLPKLEEVFHTSSNKRSLKRAKPRIKRA